MPRRVRKLSLYLSPDLRDEEALLLLWEALPQGRTQEVLRRMVKLGLEEMLARGEIPRHALDDVAQRGGFLPEPPARPSVPVSLSAPLAPPPKSNGVDGRSLVDGRARPSASAIVIPAPDSQKQDDEGPIGKLM